MKKSELGFACGKTCAECGDAVSLDSAGRFTCFSCGHFVAIQEADNTPGKLKLRKIKTGQVEFFAQESALLKMLEGKKP